MKASWRILALFGVAVLTAWPERSLSAAPEYPGLPPGKAETTVAADSLTIANRAMAAGFSVLGGKLRLLFVRSGQETPALSFKGEPFQIWLADGARYPASVLQLEGRMMATDLESNRASSRLADRIGGRRFEAHLHSADGRLGILWRAILHDDANYLRQEIEITPLREDVVIQKVLWCDESLPEARGGGLVDGSPVTVGNFFLGVEDPMSANSVSGPAGTGERRVVCSLERNAALKRAERLTLSFVVGVAPFGQMRRAFLYYLERERAHPYRAFLHYNSWYDIAWDPFSLNETNCLEAIRTLGERFIKAYGAQMDAIAFDDGWDDPASLWNFHRGFPKGFSPLAELCAAYHTGLGVWLSPFGGYGASKEQRLKFGGEQGYEINAAGFSLAGPKYYAAFKRACVAMIRRDGVNYFKFDGIASGARASGAGSAYILDTAAMRRLMLELRQEEPDLFINLTTGSWPSPFWLRYADSLWRQGDDTGFSGKGSRQQQWLTYRDGQVYANIVQRAPLYPLNSLMSHGVAYSRHGNPGDSSYNSAGFKDDVHAYFGGGTGLQELYIQPGKLSSSDWDELAEAAKWSRANEDVLVDTHWIGGDPSRLEVYGYASWSPRKGTIMLRNPDDQPHDFALEVRAAFQLPPGATKEYTLASPWKEDAGQPHLRAAAGQPLRLSLKPFEVVVYDAVP